MLEELLDPVHEKVFVDDKGGEGEQVILRDKNGQYWISEPWDDEQPGYPLSVPVPPDLAIINRADLDTHNARLAELEGQREVTERMLFALRQENARLRTLQDAVQKIDGWRDSHLLDGIYFCTGSKWHAGGDSALLGKGNGALELNWRGLWEPRHEDDVTVEAPTMREVIIALAAKLEEEA